MGDDGEEQRLRTLHQYNLLDTPREEAFDRITRLVTAVLDVPIAAVTLIDRDRQWFKSEQGLDLDETPREQSFCAHAMWGEDAMIVPDATLDPRFATNPLVMGAPDVRFYVGVPLRAADGTPLGALCGIDTKPRGIGQRELDILRDLANLTMEQLELRLLATRDGLTGATRRGPFLGAMSRDMALAQQSGRPLACLMIDADDFKGINDRWGHAVGDEILVQLVAIMRAGMRSADTLGRLGGEEFCLVLPDTALEDAIGIAERMIAAVSAIRFDTVAPELAVTISVGAAGLLPSDVEPGDLIKRADTALYMAKRHGKNRVATWSAV